MKQQDRYCFPAVFTYEPGQEIAVVFPDLDVATSGETQEDAFRSAKELLGCVLFGMEEDGEQIPAPSSLESLHMDANERSALIDVYMPAVRLAKSNKAVNRTVTLPAWLNAAAAAESINFSQLLQDALKERLNLR